MTELSWQISSLPELTTVAEALLNSCKHRSLFVFYGEMGSGKTTLIKQLCSLLGTTDAVASPTYALVNEYAIPEQLGRSKLLHMDLYRLDSIDEAMDIGIEEYLADSNSWCFIEWPGIIEPLLPNEKVTITIDLAENGRRLIKAQCI